MLQCKERCRVWNIGWVAQKAVLWRPRMQDLTKFRKLLSKLARKHLVRLGFKDSGLMEFDILDSQNCGRLGCDDVQFGKAVPNCDAAPARDCVCLEAIQLGSVHSDLRPSSLVLLVALLPCTRTILGASFGLEIGYTDWKFVWFSSVLPSKWRIVYLNRPRPLPFKSLPIYFWEVMTRF
jgi:hypothetical protein